MNIINKKAFTLAEILITLIVIGVIAVLVIPSMLLTFRNQQFRAKFLKTYSMLSQITMKTNREIGIKSYPELSADASLATEYRKLFVSNFKVNQKVITSYPSSKTYSNNVSSNMCRTPAESKVYQLPDGVEFHFTASSPILCIDLNGVTKAPNRLGYDVFGFTMGNATGGLLLIAPYKAYDSVYGNNAPDTDTGYRGTGVYCTDKSPGVAGQEYAHASNGWHCSHYAFINKNPDDTTKDYWNSLK